MDDELIQFKAVTKSFGKNVVLDSINLTIPEGQIIGVIGASGEGKSTILKLLASFYKPTKGKIYYKKKNIFRNKRVISRLFGLSIEDGSFYGRLNVKENLLHFGRLYGIKRKILQKRADELIKLVGLSDATKTLGKNLSLGMKKRLDVGCALIHNPSVLILDEPTADLDPLLRQQMIHLIKQINSHGTTVILTTQLLLEAEELCDKVAILFNEKIIEQGTATEIKKKYNSKDLNEVFNKLFSKKERKTYQESSDKKTKLKLLKKNQPLKKTLLKSEGMLHRLFRREKNKEYLDDSLKKEDKEMNKEKDDKEDKKGDKDDD